MTNRMSMQPVSDRMFQINRTINEQYSLVIEETFVNNDTIIVSLSAEEDNEEEQNAVLDFYNTYYHWVSEHNHQQLNFLHKTYTSHQFILEF